MSTAAAPTSPPATDWTCPFCALLCEGLGVDAAAAPPQLRGSTCPRATALLAAHGSRSALPAARIDGAPATCDAALAAAAQRMRSWRQPLLGGLGTDVAGARALYRLAARTDAIADHADGATLMHGVRAVQDRGQYIATLAEVRSRADVIVCVGTPAIARFPEFFRRIGLGEADSPCRSLVFLGVDVPAGVPAALPTQHIAGSGDLSADVQQLGALVLSQRVRQPDPALAALAAQLRDAHYAVLVWEGGALPAEGALVVEALNRIVGTLNKKTRAASFGLGGSDGAFSVNQTFTWLSGLPLRTRVSAAGLQHEPRAFDGGQLLAQHAVDGLFWVASFNPERVPPETTLPRIVLGPPAMAALLPDAAQDCIFIAVATPGLNAAGHLFRTDGPVVLPVVAVRDDGLPGVATVVTRLVDLLEADT